MIDIFKGKFVKILTFKELSFLSLIFDKNEVLCKGVLYDIQILLSFPFKGSGTFWGVSMSTAYLKSTYR